MMSLIGHTIGNGKMRTAMNNLALPPIGARVEGGEGDDYDTGTVLQHIAGAQVLVAWDSGVTTPAPASILTVIGLQ